MLADHGRPVLRLHLTDARRRARAGRGRRSAGAAGEPGARRRGHNPLRDPRDRRLPRIAGPCGAGDLRRHRRPGPQEADAGDLRPRQPRPAAARASRWSASPGATGPTRTSRRSCTTSVKRARPHAVPRGGLDAARRGLPVRARATSTTTPPSTSSPQTRRRARRASAAPAATTRSTCRSRRRSSATSCEQLKEHGLADPQRRRRGAGSSSRSRSATTCESRPRAQRASSTSVFPPDSVFRIDHYLGKETVQNILALRFANQMFEPIWNANYVDHVQITMAEDIGIGGRAGYYDGIGAARDVIQNHLLQLLALTAMEEPISFDAAGPARREGEGALGGRACPSDLDAGHRPRPVRRRLAGRREGRRLPRGGRHRRRPRPPRRTPRSRSTSTPAAGPGCRSTCAPASGSAAGSPRSPWCSSGRRTCRSTHDRDRGARPERPRHPGPARRGRHAAVRLEGARAPRWRSATSRWTSATAASFTESSPEAYERLILDVLLGDPPLFPRHEEVELSWQILDPIEELLGQARAAARAVRLRRLGARRRRRDDALATDATGGGRDRRPARAPPPPTSRKKLVRLRADAGAMALARVLTLLIVVDEADADDGDRGRQRRQPRAPVPDPRRRRAATSAAPPGSTPRSGSAATPARQRGRRAAALRRARRPRPTPSCIPLLLPTPRSSPGGRATRPTTPADGPARARWPSAGSPTPPQCQPGPRRRC